MLRSRADFYARLLVVLAIALDEARLERLDDHRRRLVEAPARFVHAEAEGGEFAPRQAAPHAEAKPALAQHVEHGGILGNPQRIVPGQDDGRRADIDAGMARRQVGHEVEVVGDEGVVVEVVLGRPQAVKA